MDELPEIEIPSENGGASNEDRPLRSTELHKPSLSEISTILQNQMRSHFRELNVDIVACPCLTREPFNLAGIGLCGNTSLLEVGNYTSLMPPNYARKWDISNRLSYDCHDSFIIGTGFAAKSSNGYEMPYNGHLVMNATYHAPADFVNASRVVFADTSDRQISIERLTETNQIGCNFMGNFFVSEGRSGNVLRVRAKGRKSNLDIITLMHNILYEKYYEDKCLMIGLGGVLKMRNGRVAHNVMPDRYPQQIESLGDLFRWYQYHDIELDTELVAVGTILNNTSPEPLFMEEHGVYVPTRRHQFHSFSNYRAGGQFINDITRDVTEYEGYFNLAEKLYPIDSE